VKQQQRRWVLRDAGEARAVAREAEGPARTLVPFYGRLLADFGAEVIKIEPADGDPVRTMGKHFGGKSLYAASIFRNKQLISVDLHRPEGRDIARGIALSCDVVVENFKPGTLEGWGLGWSDLSHANPRLVMVRISGFGQGGPYASRPGYGVICEGGLRHLTGDHDRPPRAWRCR
jgi:crotonobetainyl-CoA:carnitine CoA-transferase CaiB-like acyl-CoA transferase